MSDLLIIGGDFLSEVSNYFQLMSLFYCVCCFLPCDDSLSDFRGIYIQTTFLYRLLGGLNIERVTLI